LSSSNAAIKGSAAPPAFEVPEAGMRIWGDLDLITFATKFGSP
jgi:hypothetical protein